MKCWFSASLLAGAILLLGGCTKLGLNAGNGAPNDPIPMNAAVVAQGNFTSLNGQTVTGAVSVYYDNVDANPGYYVLRLASVAIPSLAGLEIVVVTGSGEQPAIPLRATDGTQNYELDYTAGSIFSQVMIRAAGTNTNYGLAELTQVN